MRLFVPFLFLFFSAALHAQQHIELYEGHIPNNISAAGLRDSAVIYPWHGDTMEFIIRVVSPDLTVFVPEQKNANRAAVIICPGGGYSGLAIRHEGLQMARRMQAAGMVAFVLKYRLPNPSLVNNKEIVPLQDAQRAIQFVRENAAKWGVDPHKIGILGSSAGGHLASTAGTHWQTVRVPNPKNTSLRPDFMILNYPVISFADSLTHYGVRYNLAGPASPQEDESEKALAKIPFSMEAVKNGSNELWVKPDTPPAFVTSAVDDDVVKVQNALVFIAALQQNMVPVQSFFYAKGGHGYGMDNPTSEVDWMDACLTWLRERGFL